MGLIRGLLLGGEYSICTGEEEEKVYLLLLFHDYEKEEDNGESGDQLL